MCLSVSRENNHNYYVHITTHNEQYELIDNECED